VKKRIRVSSAKAKGRSLQQWACQKISEITGYKWGKDEAIESRGMGQTGVDVRMERRVRMAFPFSVECKYQESWSIPAWVDQARKNILPGTDWLLIVRRNRIDPIVIMDGERFFQIQRELIEFRRGKG